MVLRVELLILVFQDAVDFGWPSGEQGNNRVIGETFGDPCPVSRTLVLMTSLIKLEDYCQIDRMFRNFEFSLGSHYRTTKIRLPVLVVHTDLITLRLVQNIRATDYPHHLHTKTQIVPCTLSVISTPPPQLLSPPESFPTPEAQTLERVPAPPSFRGLHSLRDLRGGLPLTFCRGGPRSAPRGRRGAALVRFLRRVIRLIGHPREAEGVCTRVLPKPQWSYS